MGSNPTLSAINEKTITTVIVFFYVSFFKGSAAVADEAQQHGLDGKPVVILFPFVVLVDGKGPAD